MKAIEPIVRFDLAFSSLCLSNRFHPRLAKASRVVSHTGDGPLFLIVAMLAWWGNSALGIEFIKATLFAFTLELPLYWILKNGFKRRRPFERSESLTSIIQPADQYSLPSGHTAAAFLMATMVGAFFPSLYLFALIWALLVSLSRILLGVHFFTDVLLGAALGIACARASLLLLA
ncbi:phosphatase PAP2 family protein [Vibrio sp. LaRot3]|uniref:phosphatase PAP2 family protein n=1 Tax=Vibrio sp. LaRot3 TaxID=2998829 RepID=UPI0022CE0201|nr:phosphatase PAP2 family protein [Vibrio sp. LaRot3]MDA0149679.1 phosphatase PAP2 family protein [Vibrio sp. LaRot3]